MLTNVGIICFAASYSVSLLLEVSRFFFRSGIRGAVMFGFAAAGWVAHSAYLYHHIALLQNSNQNGSLFAGVQGWLFAVAWVIAALYLYLAVYFPRTPFGIFLLPLVLAAIGAGVHFADASPFPADSVGQIWRIVHGVSFLLVTVTIFLGFVTGVMYLVQASNLKHKRPMLGHRRLPTLEWLQTTNTRLIGFLIVVLTVGILSGLALNAINMRQHRSSVSPFDPMVIMTMVMFVFLLLFAVTATKLFGWSTGALLPLWPPAREGKRLALVTLICFVALIAILLFGLLSPGHWNVSG